MNKLLPYQNENVLELGIDEAGRGTLIGPVYIAGVILPNNILELCEDENIIIKDSKKMSKKERERTCTFIKKIAIDYSIVSIDNDIIDKKNIFNATMEGMHNVINKICIKPEKILVDGDHFNIYRDENGDYMQHQCIIKGDNTYMCIAAASILAKTYKDKYIEDLVKLYPDYNKYDLLNNSGYGTPNHIDAIKIHGITPYHRKTFGICKTFL
jgi:ribonuclease HII